MNPTLPPNRRRSARSMPADGFAAGIARRAAFGLMLSAAAAGLAGCSLLGGSRTVALPARHSVRSDHLVVHSDLPLRPDHPLLADLARLRDDVTQTLELPPAERPVVIYLFEDSERYYQYMQSHFPGNPNRRAYFIGSPKELAVYTYWGDRVAEDLRHEYTHGLLHASLPHVPLWLDEGLAEYFEVPRPGDLNSDYVPQLVAAFSTGFRGDLERLESLESVGQMQRPDYREAWAWIHYMLESSPDTRRILIEHLAALRRGEEPVPLSARLRAELPTLAARFRSHVAGLTTIRASN